MVGSGGGLAATGAGLLLLVVEGAVSVADLVWLPGGSFLGVVVGAAVGFGVAAGLVAANIVVVVGATCSPC